VSETAKLVHDFLCAAKKPFLQDPLQKRRRLNGKNVFAANEFLSACGAREICGGRF
jgi:hypothetical protein